MNNAELTSMLGNEIYVVVGDDMVGELYATASWDDLCAHMQTLAPTIDDVRVYHGVLGPVEFLPNDLRNKSAFTIFQSSLDDKMCYLVDSGATTIEEFAEELAEVLTSGYIDQLGEITVERAFILYGYELSVCLGVDPEDIDEEVIGSCKEILEEVRKVSECMKPEEE
jgi:hypothetical protein